jgi:ribose transport system substrate-binding protein
MRRGWLLLAALGIVAAGCGKEPNVIPTPPSPAIDHPSPPPAVTTQMLDGVARAAKRYRIVLIVKTRNNPFFKPMIEGFEQTVKALGCEPLVEAPPKESDSEQQVAYVQDEIARGVNAICIAPADSKAIVPVLKEAAAKGIVVVNLDNRVDAATAQSQGLLLAGYVGADNAEGGRLAGKTMVAALRGKGAVAIIGGLPDADNARTRKSGFVSAVKAVLKVSAEENGDWETEKAYAKTANVLAAHADIAGIFCANDKMALGAIKAVDESAVRGKIVVVGYDNIPEAQAKLATGELYATIEQHPDLMGKYGARMAVGILGKSVAPGGELLVPLEVIRKKQAVMRGVARGRADVL